MLMQRKSVRNGRRHKMALTSNGGPGCAKVGLSSAKRGFERFVSRLCWYNPWHIVRWVYCERDKHGLRLMKKEGTTYLWKALATWALVAFCNQALMWCGFEYETADFIITDG